MSDLRVGFVGLGAMGAGMAQVLLRAGFGVRGFDVWPPAVEKFAAAGGATATDVKSCAAGADALVLMVVSADQAEDVLFGEQHAGASALPRGSVVILCSTVAPEAARALAARLAAEGLAFVDAPVSGGVARAADGALTIMASGDEHAMAKARPLLEAMTRNRGKLYTVAGGPGGGSAVKMVNQLLAGVHIVAAAEAMALGARMGLNTHQLFDVIANAAGASWMFCDRVPRMLGGDATLDAPKSALDIFVKDLGIVLSEGARSKFPLPLSAAAHQMFLMGSAMGMGRKDDAAVVRCYPGADVAVGEGRKAIVPNEGAGGGGGGGEAGDGLRESYGKEEILGPLPPQRPLTAAEVDECQRLARQRFLVVLDDDPTGTQTMHGVRVLLAWDVPTLESTIRHLQLDRDAIPGFFVMTNSRALGAPAASALMREVCTNLAEAARNADAAVSIVLRSDSTLRGHFPLENDVAAECLGPFHRWLLCPFFYAGGRFTVDGVHYVAEGDRLVPAGKTPFARDEAFGYRSSRLAEYVEEKTGGRVKAGDVAVVGLRAIREGGVQAVEDIVMGMKEGAVCVVDAADDCDLHVVCLAVLRAQARGVRVLCRTAASFVSAWLLPGEGPRAPLGPEDLPLPKIPAPTPAGLIVCGSYVPRTSAQLAALTERVASAGLPVELVWVSAELLCKETENAARLGELRRAAAAADRAMTEGRTALVATSRGVVMGGGVDGAIGVQGRIADGLVEILRAVATRPAFLIAKGGITSADAARRAMGARSAAAADRAMTEGRTALVATSRGVVMGGGVDGAIGVQGRIADGLVEILRAVATRPAFLIAKGGITSADAARRAMGARSAAVAGQAAPGVPLWVLDDECRFPGLPFVVFPGNVGSEATLADVVQRWVTGHRTWPATLAGPGAAPQASAPLAAREGLRAMLERARKGGYAIGAFNVYDVNGGAAVIGAAEACRSPAIVQVHPASLHSPGGGPPLVSALRLLARRATVPIVVHMDHMAPDDWPSALSCLADSAMVDGSHLPYEANVAATRAAVEGCRARGVDVEGELGRIAGTEDGMTVDEMEACMTDPAQAAAFALATGCAALAVCVGNAHGPYPPGGARIDLQRLVSICAAVDGVAGPSRPRPEIVLHGASGLDPDVVRACVAAGVSKFNVNTECRAAYVAAMRECGGDLTAMLEAGREAMGRVARGKMGLLGSAGKA